jgi:multidrug efflux system outer membrane protein
MSRSLLSVGLVSLGLAAMLAGCAGMPSKPKPVVLPTEAPLAGLDAPGGGAWPSQQWWQRYQDPALDQLIDMGLASSPTLGTAHARLDTARQSVRVAGAANGIQVTAVGDIERQRLSDNGLFPPQLLGFTWYNQADLGLQFSYTFDWWGKQRDLIASAMDQAHAAQADRSAAALVLTSSIADTYFGWQADQARLILARERESTVQREGAIAADRVRADLDSDDALRSNETALAAAREQIANLEGSAKLRVVALAALIGRSVADLPPLVARPLPQIPAGLPDDVTLDLIARRADITASRWRVEAAEKNLDSARAEFYPDISINALAGLSSIDIGKLLEYGSRVPQAMAAVHLPIFDSGRLKAHYGAVEASINSAVENYRETLVGAARDVATEATSRARLAAQRAQRVIETDAARQLQSSAAARVRQGVVDPRTELTATEALIEQRDALLQLDSAALSADIGLQRALGGGYDSSPATANSTPTSTTAP